MDDAAVVGGKTQASGIPTSFTPQDGIELSQRGTSSRPTAKAPSMQSTWRQRVAFGVPTFWVPTSKGPTK